MFEGFNAAGVHIANQAALSLYASGRTCGVVLSSGDGATHTVPIYEGHAISHVTRSIDLSGRDITNYLNNLLTECGHSFDNPAKWEIVRDIKESVLFFLLSFFHQFTSSKGNLGAWL